MDKITEYLIDSAENLLSDYENKAEMLEYPEVQADKQLFLRLLSEYNTLKPIYETKTALLNTEKEIFLCLSEYEKSSQEERKYIAEEIETLKSEKNKLTNTLKTLLTVSSSLPCGMAVELRAGNSEQSHLILDSFANTIKNYGKRHGFTFKETKRTLSGKSRLPRLIILETDSADASAKLNSIGGVHKIIYASALTGTNVTDEFYVTVYEKHQKTQINEEKDIKIEVFHSGGAGGQNINKVETAIRAIHLPTGITVTCQDERSQLKNKLRAIENLKKRLEEKDAEEEQSYVENVRKLQSETNRKKIVFDMTENVIKDRRNQNTERKFTYPLSVTEADVFIENI